ncbi:ATP-grasp domain-containing protein [Spirillospora sp. CA-294931]|uniref:ATP-grasp domain-containing protein n=1 Tax=Spirillospora sp. CA-294931 TaxID=3240042 RepID=UPI003D8C226D
MPTLVLSPRYTSDSKALRAAAGRCGWAAERLGGWRAPAHLRGRDDLALYGEPTFAEVIAAQLGLSLIDAPQDWLPGLPERHLRRALTRTTLAEARASAGPPMFVKPADGRKGFEGRVYEAAGLPDERFLPGSTGVLVAEPVVWDVEFRCHVLAGEIVAMSPYLREGELALTADGRWHASDEEERAAREYASTLLAEVALPPAVVVDVGHVRGRGWAVVEANAAWGAGLYGCDPEIVLRVLARACAPRESDAEWIVEPVRLDG